MKCKVTVVRIGYAFADFDIEIPDEQLKGFDDYDITTAIEEAAFEKAHNHLFSEKNSEYKVEDIQPVVDIH